MSVLVGGTRGRDRQRKRWRADVMEDWQQPSQTVPRIDTRSSRRPVDRRATQGSRSRAAFGYGVHFRKWLESTPTPAGAQSGYSSDPCTQMNDWRSIMSLGPRLR
jgi:hypothetical protein